MGECAIGNYKLVLKNPGTKKVNVIRHIREITGLGLREAKNIVDECKDGAQDVVVAGGLCYRVADIKLEHFNKGNTGGTIVIEEE